MSINKKTYPILLRYNLSKYVCHIIIHGEEAVVVVVVHK